ncbi:MAG TPA: acyl-CoA carboxylase subunit epsilon [Mycobacteriales bacterium]|nr:acyl-CoA carboxylase subunit epsilon [Mycobacteriales bacterium]
MSEQPLLRVVRGNPTDTELAVLTAVLAARSSAGQEAPMPTRSEWARGSGVRRPLPAPGPGAWRTAARPPS